MIEDRVRDLARKQHGIICRQQLHDLGASDKVIQRLSRSRLIERTYPGVYSLAGVVVTGYPRIMAAVLAAGEWSAASHRSAAFVHGLVSAPGVVEVSVPHR